MLAFSYLGYGLLAARAKILEVSDDSGNPCILNGFNGKYYFGFLHAWFYFQANNKFYFKTFSGSYIYGGKSYKASSTPSGASLNECKSIALKALKVNGSNVHIRSALLGGYGMVVGVMNRKTFLLPHFSLTGQLRYLLFYSTLDQILILMPSFNSTLPY